MIKLSIKTVELSLASLAFAVGLTYLMMQTDMVNRILSIVNEEILYQGDVYQQYNYESINQISDEELSAIIMGYREYSIMIDEVTIDIEGTDYEDYLGLIKEGSYVKKYVYDANHYIKQIKYAYVGT